MSSVVFIGGFGNGKSSAETVGTALEEYYEDIDVFTLSYALSHPERIRKAVHGTSVLTHSAGMLALQGTRPGSIDALNAPLAATVPSLLWRTIGKTVRMHTPGIGVQSGRDALSVAKYNTSALAELGAHPVRNLGNLTLISRFDALASAIKAQENGIPTALGYTTGDEYFTLRPISHAIAEARQVEVTILPGIHDELLIRPAQTLDRYYNGVS